MKSKTKNSSFSSNTLTYQHGVIQQDLLQETTQGQNPTKPNAS